MYNFPSNAIHTALVVSASQSTTVTTAAHDLLQYEGPALLVQNKGAGAGTLDGKLQHSDDGATGWTDTGLAFAQATTAANLQALAFNPNSLRRYVRYVGTVVTGPHLLGVTLHATRKYS
jgi:hypothetical protein